MKYEHLKEVDSHVFTSSRYYKLSYDRQVEFKILNNEMDK